MMNLINVFRFGLLLGAVFAVTHLPSAAWAQCGADPEGNPIGVVSRPDAKGPSLTGVGMIEFLDSDGLEAHGARVLVRLRRSNTMLAFFARIPDSVTFNIETPEDTQEELFAALRGPVLAAFFPDECGADPEVDLCPDVGLVFKRIEEFAVTDDVAAGGSSQFVISDIVVATTEPL
jgi:hypothetical protein